MNAVRTDATRGGVWKNIIASACLTLCSVACKGPAGAPAQTPPTPATTAQPAGVISSDVEAPERATPAASEALAGFLRELRDKQRCNKVMGCEPSIGLMQFGTEAVPAILETLEGQAIDGRYWQLKSFDILGQLGDTRATSVLHTALTQSRWEVRCRAALALGRIADPKSTGPLQALLDKHLDVATDAAALFALGALSVQVDGLPARDQLKRVLPKTKEGLGALNPGHYAFLAELVGAAQLREALQLTRWGAMHKDRFTRMASLETLAALKDREGIPYAVTRLEDPSPGVKRQALRTLRVITGKRAFTRPEHWLDWCEQRQCLRPLRELRDSSPPGSTVKPRGEDPGAGNVGRNKQDLR